MIKFKFSRKNLCIILFTLLFSTILPMDFSAKVKEFKDVEEDQYYYEAIQELSNRGIVNGFEDNSFKPKKAITRGQAAKILSQTLQLDLENIQNPNFVDVLQTHPYYKEIAALSNAGLIKGFEDNTFRTNAPLTRAQMAKIITEGFGFALVDYKNNFTDVKHSDWYANYVQTLASNAITTGVTAKTFEPNSSVTRGQLAAFIIRSERARPNFPTIENVITIAGDGYYDLVNGKPINSSFRSPSSIELLTNGTILVSDSENHLLRLIQNDNVTTFAGVPLVDKNGNPLGALYNASKKEAIFSTPKGIVEDKLGNIYIADSANHVIRKITKSGEVGTLAGDGLPGYADGVGENTRFYYPQDIAVANDGSVYVTDTLNHVIRKIEPSGQVTTLNSLSTKTVEVVDGVIESVGDFQDGALNEAKFNEPSGITIDSKGNLYVSDTGNQLIRYIDFTTNTVSTVAGTIQNGGLLYREGGFQDGPALQAKLNSPKGLAVTDEGGLLIADRNNHAIRYLLNGTLTTLSIDFNFPLDVAISKDGEVYVADSYSNTIKKFELNR